MELMMRLVRRYIQPIAIGESQLLKRVFHLPDRGGTECSLSDRV